MTMERAAFWRARVRRETYLRGRPHIVGWGEVRTRVTDSGDDDEDDDDGLDSAGERGGR